MEIFFYSSKFINYEIKAAPSDNVLNFAYAISGSTAPNPAKVPKPQSVPATTLSSPTIFIKRSIL